MYSSLVRKALEEAGLSIGARLRYTTNTRKLEGRLMPRPENGDLNCLVIKLDSGYNVGLSIDGATLEKITDASPDLQPSASGPSSPSPSTFPPVLSPAPKLSSSASPAFSPSHPNRAPVMLLSTGGTIASRVDYKTGAVHPQTDAAQMLAAFPRLSSFAPLRTTSLFSILSEDMRPEYWKQMAQAVADAFNDGAEGVIVSHGTDTMGYSAAALSYALENVPGPVILTGAQRSPDRASTDAAQNLYCSAAAARSPLAAVSVCMHANSSDTLNHLHWGTRVRKSHTSGRWAFRSIGIPPLGRVMADSGQVIIDDETAPRKNRPAPSANAGASAHPPKFSLHPNFSSNVHLAWVYPGLNSKTVSSWSNYDGIVIASTGLHGVPIDALRPDSPHSVLPALRSLIDSGILVALAPQALGGRVNMDVYSTGRLLQEAGVLGHLADWLPETAYVKMCWALGQEKDKKKATALLMRPRAHDITERSTLGDEDSIA